MIDTPKDGKVPITEVRSNQLAMNSDADNGSNATTLTNHPRVGTDTSNAPHCESRNHTSNVYQLPTQCVKLREDKFEPCASLVDPSYDAGCRAAEPFTSMGIE